MKNWEILNEILGDEERQKEARKKREKLYNYFIKYPVDTKCLTKQYSIETYSMFKQSEIDLTVVNKAFEDFSKNCSLIQKFTSKEIDVLELNKYVFGQEDNSDNKTKNKSF